MKNKKASQHDERNERIVKLAQTLGAAQIVRVLQGDYPGLTRNMVIGVMHRQCPQDAKTHNRRRQEGVRMQKVAMAGKPRPGKLGTAEPTAQQRAKAKPVPPRPMVDPAMRPPAQPGLARSHVLINPLPGSTPVPYAQRTGCVWPFGERSGLMACNLPKCRVKAFGVVSEVNYCSDHWDARRSTKHTQIVA